MARLLTMLPHLRQLAFSSYPLQEGEMRAFDTESPNSGTIPCLTEEKHLRAQNPISSWAAPDSNRETSDFEALSVTWLALAALYFWQDLLHRKQPHLHPRRHVHFFFWNPQQRVCAPAGEPDPVTILIPRFTGSLSFLLPRTGKARRGRSRTLPSGRCGGSPSAGADRLPGPGRTALSRISCSPRMMSRAASQQ